jgi:hypothetical protein
MYVPLFCCFLLEVYIDFTFPRSSNWTSPLYGTPRSTQKCTVARHISSTSAAIQFHHLPNDGPLPLYDEMKLWYSSIMF